MTVQGRSVRLYLVEGTPTGILTAEIMNWTGHVLVSPRSRLGDALLRDEASRTGVYFLVGDDPDQPTKSRVYIGEGDSVVDRIKSHARDASKDFWTRACLVTSKDMNLTKAHARYLENRLIDLTKQADRANLANGNEPGPKSLPESDIADMEFFISQVQVVLPVIGFDFLRPHAKPASAPSGASIATIPSKQIELVLSSAKHGYQARAVEFDGEFTVLAGSRATAKSDFAVNSYGLLRQQLIKDGRIVPDSDVEFLKFAEDVSFPSASAAAAVISNRNANGRTAWKLPTGQTLKEWQDAQLGVSPAP
ncbi:GIY-YIG nuclease family protein [Ancylobacter oerskovii]|uniref:GIY-YIG nuclease family protein n=1 Tax=Ancylobacter oerskovii TaxID=459519 RepID=A0ABW4YYR5_9HYPH|nr:GIY-YIG nuclease family protein [Ancylobacter oerskovii]MBS7546406.1 GIY-YIG nuclease family protein [Ancylobacter oerskovii]